MTKRDFIAVAAILAAEIVPDAYADFECGREWARCQLADKLAVYFSESNPNFDRERFISAALAD